MYGYLIHENLKNIDTIRSIDDSKIETMTNLGVGLSYDDAKELSDLCDAIKNVNGKYIKENLALYLRKVTSYLLPNDYITYNSIILFTLQLFNEYPELLRFYNRYFPIMIVDEFQDTNIINYALLRYFTWFRIIPKLFLSVTRCRGSSALLVRFPISWKEQKRSSGWWR